MSYFKASLYALLTAPLILFNVSHAKVFTTGDLSYDDSTEVITNTITKQTYLGWDVLSSYTYLETVDATASGRQYSDYHIANFDEAKTFFEAAIDGSCTVTSDATTACDGNYQHGFLGDNGLDDWDAAWFLGSNAGFAGRIYMNALTGPGAPDYFYDVLQHPMWTTDRNSHSGVLSHIPISWLLVANTTSAVPVPAAIWLFGTALIGLVGYGKRKSKVPV